MVRLKTWFAENIEVFRFLAIVLICCTKQIFIFCLSPKSLRSEKKQVGLILWLEFLALKCSNLSKPFALDRDVLRNEEGGGDLGYGAGMHKAGLSYITQFYRLKCFNGNHTSAKLFTTCLEIVYFWFLLILFPSFSSI